MTAKDYSITKKLRLNVETVFVIASDSEAISSNTSCKIASPPKVGSQ